MTLCPFPTTAKQYVDAVALWENRKREVYDLYYNQGKTQTQIGKRYGVGTSTICGWMKRWGWKARDRAQVGKQQALNRWRASESHRFWSQHADEIVDLLNEGKTQAEIGKHLGVTQSAVSDGIKKVGIKMIWVRERSWL